jgi:phosphoesterase family protein
LDELLFRCADFRNLPSDDLPVRYTATLPTAFGVPDAGGDRHAAVRFVCRSELRVLFSALVPKNDEHPPTDIRKGEAFVSQVVKAVRNGPNWKDSIIFITYDEHGGFYDHVPPAPAPQDGALNPDGIDPGQCADLSNPPLSEVPATASRAP